MKHGFRYFAFFLALWFSPRLVVVDIVEGKVHQHPPQPPSAAPESSLRLECKRKLG